MVKIIVEEANEVGLVLNEKKCATFGLDGRSTYRRHPIKLDMRINDKSIPSVSPNAMYKYLGTYFNGHHIIENVIRSYKEKIRRIDDAPIKVHQKIYILKPNLIPSIIHQLKLAEKENIGKLKNKVDKTNRKYVRKWLRLNNTASTAQIHLKEEEGGLGVPMVAPLLFLQRKAIDERLKVKLMTRWCPN
ncbi:hypothetical protein SNEBB_009913 [Seison nebaliae]|nr:hypothetical protein SNEBB_009913 [Seison nebaliae]